MRTIALVNIEPLIKKVLIFLFLTCLFCSPVWADIDVNAATALIAIETPEGDRASFDPGEEFGTIAEDSLVEIIEGSADISIGEGSKCTVKIGCYFFFLDGGDYVAFGYDSLAGSCSVTVSTGSVEVRQGLIGTVKNLPQGIDIDFTDVSDT